MGMRVRFWCSSPIRYGRRRPHLDILDASTWVQATLYILPAGQPPNLHEAIPEKIRYEETFEEIKTWAFKECDRWEKGHPDEAEGKVGFVAYVGIPEHLARELMRRRTGNRLTSPPR